jgi:hypothetical protein
MAVYVERSVKGRKIHEPDLFLSHSSRDKNFVRELAEDLTFCEVDVWLDEWEISPGDSLHDALESALEKSRFVAIVLGDNFADSRWARDEMKQAMSRERRSNQTSVLPLLVGKSEMPAFLEDKVYIDFRKSYFTALARLAGTVHKVSRKSLEETIRLDPPGSLRGVINGLRYCGVEPYIVLGEDEYKEIATLKNTKVLEDRVRFNPHFVQQNTKSPRIKRLMEKLNEVWGDH